MAARDALTLLVCGALALVTGCVPGLDGYRVLPPGVDGGPRPSADAGIGGQRGGPCPMPTLLVTLEDLSGAPETVGRVLRYTVTEQGLRACPSIDGSGELHGQPFSVVGDDDFMVVSSRQGVQGVSTAGDRVEWEHAVSMHPNDSFRWREPGTGEELYAVAWSMPGQCAGVRCSIRRVTIYDRAGAMRHDLTGLPVGSAQAMARSPLDPSRAMVVSPSNFGAAELDLLAPELFNTPPHVATGGHFPQTLAVFTQSGTTRYAWAGQSEGEPVALYLNDVTGSPGQQPFPIDACACELIAVVPDPVRPRGLIGACARGGVARDLVRIGLDGGGTCEVLAEGASMPDTRMSALSLAGL